MIIVICNLKIYNKKNKNLTDYAKSNSESTNVRIILRRLYLTVLTWEKDSHGLYDY